MAARRSLRRAQRRATSLLVVVAMAAFLLASSVISGASPTSVGLGTAGNYSALAGSTITNTGDSVLHQSLGLHPGTSVTGFTFSGPPGPGTVMGTVDIDDAIAEQAKLDLQTAYLDAAGRSLTDPPLAELAGLTLTAGVYGSASSLLLSGLLILDGQGDPNSVFIFQAGSELTAASGSSVQLINNAQACNVFWQVGSSATVGSGSSFKGTIMALDSITLVTGATLEGRALARNAALTLDTNTIFQPGCDLAAGGDDDTTTTTVGEGDTTATTTDGDTTTTTASDDDAATIVDTGAGLTLVSLIGGLVLLVAGGGTIAVAKRRRADLR